MGGREKRSESEDFINGKSGVSIAVPLLHSGVPLEIHRREAARNWKRQSRKRIEACKRRRKGKMERQRERERKREIVRASRV